MNIEIINTGTELLLGRVLNTHQEWLCRQLADLGYVVERQVAIADTANAIENATREALARADLVITTGGLGPTSDDLTRDRIAALLGRKLVEDASIVAHIEAFFAARKRCAPERTRVQALVPEGGRVLSNPNGTAPGLAIEIPSNAFRAGGAPAWLIMLPGPPRELRPMFTDSVVPFLREIFPLEGGFVCRTFKTTGLGESLVEEKVEGPLKPFVDAGLEVGFCARTGEVDVRLGARGPNAASLVADAERVVRQSLGRLIFSGEDEELETVLVRMLTERQKTLALAESCTGGFISHRVTNVPGASAVLVAGWVTYSNEAKQSCLGVRTETLAEHGAVSELVAREMAEGARRNSGADFALAVTGIAGPTGGSETKPVGTVHIALATPERTLVLKSVNRYDRPTFKYVTSQQALDILRRELTASETPFGFGHVPGRI